MPVFKSAGGVYAIGRRRRGLTLKAGLAHPQPQTLLLKY